MTFCVETIATMDLKPVGYSIGALTGGDESLPIELFFSDRTDAVKLCKWLNKREDWVERLETIVEFHTDVNLEKIKEKKYY